MKELFIYAKKLGIDDIQVVTISKVINSVKSNNGIIMDIKYGESVFYKVKAIYKGKSVGFTVSKLDKEVICKRIISFGELIQNDEKDRIIESGHITCDEPKYDMDISNYRDVLIELYNRHMNDKIQMIVGYYEKSIRRIRIENSNGVYMEDEKKSDDFYYSVTANDGDRVVSYDREIYNPSMDKILEVSGLVANTATNKLDEGTIDSGKYSVLINNKALTEIWGVLLEMFNADNVYYKKSLLGNKLNEEIVSDKIIIVEDPTNGDFPGKCLFDDEGTLTYKKLVIDNGVLKTYLHSLRSANRDGAKPTGNMFGRISARNMYIEPGSKSVSDLMEMMSDGIFIDTVIGTHVGVDIVSGIISLQAEGYIIRNGRRDKAIKQFVISTDFITLFNSVIEIGNDLEFDNEVIACPSILFSNISIAS